MLRTEHGNTAIFTTNSPKMAKQFHTLKVTSLRAETQEAVQIGFKLTGSLKETFAFDPGQYLTLKVGVNGQLLRRAYSICSPVQASEIRVLVKRLPSGRVSTYMNEQLKVGDKLEVMPPGGHFKLTVDKIKQSAYYFFGAGSGITPLTSMIESILEIEPNSTCHLLYGNRDEDNIIFKEKLDRLQLVYRERFSVDYVLSQPKKEKIGGVFGLITSKKSNWKGKIGRVKESLIRSFLASRPQKEIKGYYICGPGQMIEATVAALKNLAVDSTLIHREYFSAPEPSAEELMDTPVKSIRDKPSKVTVILEGVEKELVINDNTNIVQALIDAEIEPPYSCLAGTCSTCMAKLTKGEVRMDVSIGLEEDERAQGYILTCQSHPITDEVVVSYDID